MDKYKPSLLFAAESMATVFSASATAKGRVGVPIGFAMFTP
jgi:hypothetical protein